MTTAVAEEPKAAVSREQQILNAVDDFLRVQSDWENDPRTPDVPTEFFREAIEDAVYIADAGDVPAVCRDLVLAMSRLGVEWEDYVNGSKVGQLTKQGPRPADSFWAAVRGVINARAGAVRPQFRPPEPVFLLLEQKVGEGQIALIWSVDGKGPFYGQYGIDVAKIREEAAKPGMHTTEWIQQQTERLNATVTKLVRKSLDSANSAEMDRPARNRFVPDPASIEQLLREGQFPGVIAKVKGVPLEDVFAEANRLGIAVEQSDLKDLVATPGAPAKTPVVPAETLDDAILALSDSGKGAAEITKELKAAFPRVNPQKVAAVLREAKKAKAGNVDDDQDDDDSDADEE